VAVTVHVVGAVALEFEPVNVAVAIPEEFVVAL
jgi:hypothetical protein